MISNEYLYPKQNGSQLGFYIVFVLEGDITWMLNTP